MRKTVSDEELFWQKVDKSGRCWLWLGSLGTSGYGTAKVNRKSRTAHRYAYEIAVGPIPEGMQIDHLCRIKTCVRPDHLEPVTPRENQRRWMVQDGRGPAVTVCPRGHEYTPENTYYQPGYDGRKRACLTCKRTVLRGKAS